VRAAAALLLGLGACGGLDRFGTFGRKAADSGPPESGAALTDTAGRPPDCPDDTCGDTCVDLDTDPRNCGACGRTCLLPGAEAACVDGDCALGACDDGLLDCDGRLETGCEQVDACADGSACPTSCGTEGAVSCADPCAPSCEVPAEACNAQDDDCDGACDEDLSCRRAVYRSSGTRGHLYGLDPSEATSSGQTLEGYPYFYVYAAEAPGLAPLYRCDKGGGLRFLTLSASCEIGLPVDLIVGYVSATGGCGSTPLYRLYSPSTGDHFYTLSAEERDAAVAVYGYVSEGVAAQVWGGP
jgi:hypothetical protein